MSAILTETGAGFRLAVEPDPDRDAANPTNPSAHVHLCSGDTTLGDEDHP